MISNKLKLSIKSYKDFPKKGIIFRDFLPILQEPTLFKELIDAMSENKKWDDIEAIIAIDARGFLLGSSVAQRLNKPLIVARKPGKLPGDLLSGSYNLEYGENTLCIQKESLINFEKFCIVDDLLATGGTVACVEKMLSEENKKITGVAVIIELLGLNGQDNLISKVESIVKY